VSTAVETAELAAERDWRQYIAGCPVLSGAKQTESHLAVSKA
jgi:hypothetical protein